MKLKLQLFLMLGLLLVASSAHGAGDIVITDFEGKTYGDWKTTGEAFGPGPAKGGFPNQMKLAGFQGKGLANSFFKGDRSVGTLTSPPFKIERHYIKFLIGGGQHPGQTCINLLVAGKAIRTATGPNGKPGGSENLDWAQWDVADLAGQSATIEIVDQARGGWGHINVDQITQSDVKLPTLVTNPSRQIKIEKRYLNLPVKTGAPTRRVSFSINNKIEREFEIELTEEAPDFWVFLDLAPFQGQAATLTVDRLPENSSALAAIKQADAIAGTEYLYREPLRPQIHFSSRRGWNNDPNGLVFANGEYHLFYQHNPYGWKWGNMHWGHAVSADMVHWKELPIALYPHQFGDWAFSGSAVVDAQNTAGFKSGAEDVIVAAYTSTGRGECIVYSNDRGRTFTEYEGNPVVTHRGRDPRLLWHAPTKQWVMAVYDEDTSIPKIADKTRDREARAGIVFHTSPDLKHWTRRGRVGGFYECPDMFELPVDGDRAHTKWVLTAASSDYMIGQFNGGQFTPETPKLPGHRGAGFYAAQTFSNIPATDGRRIQIGWGQMPSPGMPFNQMMACPCQLTLRTLPEGVRLCFEPVKEIESLRGAKKGWEKLALLPGENPLAELKGDLFDLDATFTPGDADKIVFTVRGMPVVYDAKKQTLTCQKKSNPLAPVDGKVRLRLLLDRTSLEIYANGGRLFMPMALTFDSSDKSLKLATEGGRATIDAMDVYELKSAWK